MKLRKLPTETVQKKKLENRKEKEKEIRRPGENASDLSYKHPTKKKETKQSKSVK